MLLHIILHSSRNTVHALRLRDAQPPVEVDFIHNDIITWMMNTIFVSIAFFLSIAGQLHSKGLSGVFAELQILDRDTSYSTHYLHLWYKPHHRAVGALVKHIKQLIRNIVQVAQF